MIRDIPEKVAGHDWYSSMDVFKGYWQIRIRKEDRDKVAVSTSLGTLRYAVMCMGLKECQRGFSTIDGHVVGRRRMEGDCGDISG